MDSFRSFYQHLYTSQRSDTIDFLPFFDDTALAWLLNAHREFLLAHFEDDELTEAIMQLQNGKSPGPDGLPAEFYKAYKHLLIPVLRRVFEEARDTGTLPATMREALIIALPKPDKTRNRVELYRPLSLINVDAKILAKFIANRIGPLMTFLVRPDQSGFVPSRSTAHNLRTLFALMQDLDPDSNAVAVFLDATKAFDSLEWDYLAFVLRRMGFPPPFLNWIGLLYTDLTASVRINGSRSATFSIGRGTRQGCPLSPLLFALAVEPLAAKVHQHYRDNAIIYPARQILISLYADDITLYLRDPASSLNPILRVFIHFGRLSGVTINWQKSQIFPLTPAALPFQSEYPLDWCDDTLKYLGIVISRDKDEIMRANYGRATESITASVTRWIALPLSMAGRASLIKMAILPKLLYLFINIPWSPGRHFFKTIRGQLQRLVWGGKQARISWEMLTRPHEDGGFEIPDLELYYICAQAHYLTYWMHPPLHAPHGHRGWANGSHPQHRLHKLSCNADAYGEKHSTVYSERVEHTTLESPPLPIILPLVTAGWTTGHAGYTRGWVPTTKPQIDDTHMGPTLS